MAKITITQTTIPGFQYDGATAKLRIYANKRFVASDGEIIHIGNPKNEQWYKQISCTVSANVLTIPSFVIDSTDDSSDETSTYLGAFFDSTDTQIGIWFSNYSVPSNRGTTLDFTDIILFNESVSANLPDTFYNANAINILFNTLDVPRDLSDLNDADTSGAIADDALIFDGSNWIAQALPRNLSQLNDVQISTPSNGELLSYNGLAWENTAPTPIGTGSLFFDASKLQNINHGCFWRPNIFYSHFFWEAWVKPYYSASDGNWLGYHISDNQGGHHNLLWGMDMGGGTYVITGNLFNGSGNESFTTDERFPANYWTHLAVGWDGSHIMLWADGILTHVQAYSGTRSQDGGNNFTLHIGGSDHNNFWGNIAQVRGYEGFGRCAQVTDFTPELSFRPLSASPTAIMDMPEFCVNYQTDSTLYIDTSAGFEGNRHHGVRVAQLSVLGGGEQAPSFNDLAIPTFDANDILYGDYVPTPPSTPSGALVWDSFSRANVTALNTSLAYPASGLATLGKTEAGSLGQLDWVSDSGSFPFGTGQLFNGRAVMSYSGASALLQTNTQNVDIRVNRLPNSVCTTSIYFRYKDANDNYKIYGGETGLTLRKVEGGVSADVAVSVTAGWTTLRVVANGTSLSVYTGTGTEGTFTLQGTYTITNVSGATKHGLFNSQFNIKTVYRADNFLIKAG